MGGNTGAESAAENPHMLQANQADLGEFRATGNSFVKSTTNADLKSRQGKGSGLQKDNIFEQNLGSLNGATNASHASYAATPNSSHYLAPQSRIFSSDGRRAFVQKKRRNIFTQNPGFSGNMTSAS